MTPTARLWLLVAPAALVVGAAATALVAVSDHMDVPRLQAVLTALTGGSFIVAGLIARTRRPLNRTGWLLIAVGFAWFASAGLMAANDSVPWTIGIAASALPAGFLIHLLLAYPSGHLQSRWESALVATGYALVTVGNFSHMPIQPEPWSSCEDCPSNAFLVSDQPTAADVLALTIRTFAAAYLLAVVVTLLRRWRDSSPAARRVLTPVLLAGGTSLAAFAVMVGAESWSQTVAQVAGWIGQVVLIAVPFLFLTGLLKSRLARADISRAVLETPTGGAQGRVRELLHDPTAELLYACAEPRRGYVDVNGRPRELVAGPGRAITTIEGEGRPVAAIVHDEALLDEPELLEQVAATVGLEIERDQNLFALQASERRSRALVEAIPDNMFRISSDGIFLDIQEGPGATRPVQAEVGGSVYDYPVPRELVDRVMAAGTAALRTGELQTIEWELGEDGDLRYQEGRFVPSGEHEFFLVVRDVTDRKRQEVQQAALHRVALAVASEGRSEHVFHLVAAEVGRLLSAHAVKLLRYDKEGDRAELVGHWSERGSEYPIPAHDPVPMAGNPMHLVYETGRPIRVDLKQPMRPELAARLRKHRINSLVAAPITVSGRLWGVVAASLEPPHYFWRGAEERLLAFTQLVSLALANEEARGQLEASRARIVSAGDDERRRLERNLHDGAQQRLVSLSLSLRLAQGKLRSDPEAAKELLTSAGDELGVALEELRELARGIHPAVLTERGLGPALQSLCDRAPLPVELQSVPDERLPKRVEAAAYYVVSEALANVAKYAHATGASVSVEQGNGTAVVEVADDGIGGADPDAGSGLRGLSDRVDALDGHLHIVSPPGGGTMIRAEIPCSSPRTEMSRTPI
jgi:signal transduction histidine kinase